MRSWSRGGGSTRVLIPAILVVIFLGSCAPPNYEYVRNTSARTAFKVPREWTLFDKATFLGTPPGPQANTPDPIQWLVAFDANPTPAVENVLNNVDLATEYPQGIALVFNLSFENRDSINFQTLRNFLFPVDYFKSDDVQFLGYDDNVLLDDNQIRGVHMDFEFRQSALPGAEAALAAAQGQAGNAAPTSRAFPVGAGTSAFSEGFVRVNQIAYLDAHTNRMYLFVAVCSAECYQRSGSAIQTAVDSWTVLP